MMNRNSIIATAFSIALSSLALPSIAATAESLMGDPGSPAAVNRIVKIGADTRFVNIQGGQTVQFDVNGKQFIWNFNGTPSAFDLNSVAPAGLLDHKVTAYVSPNPLYR
jgi:hypothetical protein